MGTRLWPQITCASALTVNLYLSVDSEGKKKKKKKSLFLRNVTTLPKLRQLQLRSMCVIYVATFLQSPTPTPPIWDSAMSIRSNLSGHAQESSPARLTSWSCFRSFGIFYNY
ncbi:hypothetical protein PUN28_004544 [Cardiocondyla obscurior]|uniref:Uncharacterized protein n=1 Tax=Cardiocondyla obscurior TaxID=286306 RepID=A0AAW2GG08_9HYME